MAQEVLWRQYVSAPVHDLSSEILAAERQLGTGVRTGRCRCRVVHLAGYNSGIERTDLEEWMNSMGGRNLLERMTFLFAAGRAAYLG